MRKHHVTLTDPISEMMDAQVKNGRYKDISAAVQDAAWHFFLGPPSPFADYGVTLAEADRAAERELVFIRNDRKTGQLKPWKPGK